MFRLDGLPMMVYMKIRPKPDPPGLGMMTRDARMRVEYAQY